MDKLRNEYINFREKIFCQEIEVGQMKEFSDRVKSHLNRISTSSTSSSHSRNAYKLIILLSEMQQHNESLNTAAAPSTDTVRVFDINLTLNQLQTLKRSIQKLEEPTQILDSLEFLLSLLITSKKLTSSFYMNCKTLSDLLFHYKRILLIKNSQYRERALSQILVLLDYGRQNHSTLLADHFHSHTLDTQIQSVLQEEKHVNSISAQKCSEILKSHFTYI